jgi:ribosomal-protein-alanine N-acetyltransferase
MTTVAVTERLMLREFSPADAEALYALNADPEVVRYTGDRAFRDIEEARQLLANYDSYRQRGFGRWSVNLNETTEYIGFCGLAHRSETDEVDLGFRFYRACWGKGYATEAGLASLAIGFEHYGLDRIVGRAMEANLASHRVLTRLGMRRVFSFEREGQRWVQYEITAAEFTAFQATAPEGSSRGSL